MKKPAAKRKAVSVKAQHPSWNLKALKASVNKVRKFPENTCPASRHVQMMGEYLPTKRGYPMLHEEPEHCAQSMLATVLSLYEARSELARWRRDYAGWCVAMVGLGVTSFGTLDEAFKKLKKRATVRRCRVVVE